MFKYSIRLFRIFGIEVRLDYSWFIIFALFAFYFGFYYFPSVITGLLLWQYIVITLITVILFFLSVIFHEMSHSLVARKRGMPIKKISLFIFGGMAHIEKEPENPTSEFIMSIAGPASSFLLAVIFGAIWQLSGDIAVIVEPAKYLTLINIILGAFNLLPGFPLDGGRILRSIIWKAKGDLRKATFIATTSGRIIGFMMMAGGFLMLFFRPYLNGIWLIFIGWFLQSAAAGSYRQFIMENSIKGTKIEEFLKKDMPVIEPETSVYRIVNEYFLKKHFSILAVSNDEGQLSGIISARDIKGIPREQWKSKNAADIVRTPDEKHRINIEADAAAAFRRVLKDRLNYIAVMSGGKLAGFVTREDLLRFVKIQSQFS